MKKLIPTLAVLAAVLAPAAAFAQAAEALKAMASAEVRDRIAKAANLKSQ